MGDFTINEKYHVVNTLFSDQNQSVYYVYNSFWETKSNLIMNEIKDKKIVSQLVEVFLEDNETLRNSFIEFFFTDSRFYVVSKIAPGESLGNVILKTNLSETEKMNMAASFVRELARLEGLPLSIQHVLCSFGNISVVDHKDVYFNHFLSFTKEDFDAKKEDIIAKAGDILAAIYMNSLYFRPEDLKKLPEEVYAIITSCLNKEYTSTFQLSEDFAEYVRAAEEGVLASYGMERLYQRDRVFLTRVEKNDRAERKRRKARQQFATAALIAVMVLIGVLYSVAG